MVADRSCITPAVVGVSRVDHHSGLLLTEFLALQSIPTLDLGYRTAVQGQATGAMEPQSGQSMEVPRHCRSYDTRVRDTNEMILEIPVTEQLPG